MGAESLETDGSADTSVLQYLLFLARRAQALKEATQNYEIARLDLTGIDDQEDLLLANLRLENALDDLRLSHSRLEILTLQLTEEKSRVKSLEVEGLSREAYIANQEVEVSERHAALEQRIQEFQKRADDSSSTRNAELEKLIAGHELWKSQLSNELVSLVRERNFVWDQLKRIEADYCRQQQIKQEKLQQAVEEIQQLRNSVERAQRLGDEKGVELTILKMELQKAEDECYDMKQTLARLSAQEDPDTSSSTQLEAQEVAAAEQSAKRDELQKALSRIDELTRDNVNLRAMYMEMETRLQNPDPPTQAARKTMVTRNLTAQLENVATKDTTSAKRIKADPTSAKTEKSRKHPGKRKLAETTDGRLRKARK